MSTFYFFWRSSENQRLNNKQKTLLDMMASWNYEDVFWNVTKKKCYTAKELREPTTTIVKFRIGDFSVKHCLVVLFYCLR